MADKDDPKKPKAEPPKPGQTHTGKEGHGIGFSAPLPADIKFPKGDDKKAKPK